MGQFTYAIMPAKEPISLGNLAEDLLATPAMQAAQAWWIQRGEMQELWIKLGFHRDSYFLPAGFGLSKGHRHTLELFHGGSIQFFLSDKQTRNAILTVAEATARLVRADRILYVSETGRYPLPLDEPFPAIEGVVGSDPVFFELQCDHIYTREEVRSFPESKFEYMLQVVNPSR